MMKKGGGCLPRKINQKSWALGQQVGAQSRPGLEWRGAGGGAGRRGRGGRALGAPLLAVAA